MYVTLNRGAFLGKMLWLPVVMGVVLLAVRGTGGYAAWLKNLAVLELTQPWFFHIGQQLDPPCTVFGGLPKAEDRLSASYRLHPENSRVLTHLGRILWLEGRCDLAISQWEQAYALTDSQDAAFELFRVNQNSPLSLPVRQTLAQRTYNQAQILESSGSLLLYSRVLDLLPEETEPMHWQAMGELAMLNNEWVSAALAFTRGANLTPDSMNLWLEAGNAWEKGTDWEQASKAYESALNAQPDSVWPLLKLGGIYRLKGDYQNALHLYSQAKDMAPEATDPYFHLGVTYYLMQDYDQAQYYLEKVLALLPEHASAKFHLAQVMYKQGDFDQAKNWLLAALDNYPDAPVAWWVLLGDWQLEWNDCEAAKETYLHARDLGEDAQVIETKLTAIANECDN